MRLMSFFPQEKGGAGDTGMGKIGSSAAILSGKPLSTVFVFAIPIILGNVFQQLYNIIDAVCVGRFLGDLPLAGISVASPIMDIANALIIGGTLGVGVLIAQLCGAGDYAHLRTVDGTSLTGGLLLTVLMSAAGILFSGPLLRLQGTEEAVCREAVRYLNIIFAGLVFNYIYNFFSAALRSYGNSRTPFFILMFSSVLHALLDFLFAGVFRFGITGVAASTVICEACSAALSAWYVFRYCAPLRVDRENWRPVPAVGREVFAFAWAAALQQAVVCIGRVLVQGMLTYLGTEAVTGYNMGMRTEAFLFCFSQGISASMVVCLSQNYGRKDYRRMLHFCRAGIFIEVVIAVCFGAILRTMPDRIVSIFSENPEVIAAGALYSGTMSLFYLFSFLGEIIQGTFRGMGRLRLTMVASILQIVLRVVLAWYLTPRMGIPGVCIAVISGWILLVLIEGSYLIHCMRRLVRSAPSSSVGS